MIPTKVAQGVREIRFTSQTYKFNMEISISPSSGFGLGGRLLNRVLGVRVGKLRHSSVTPPQ
jgi:hypothetical protein